MDVEQNAEQMTTTPTAETMKADESKTPVEETETPVTNGNATTEELVVKIPEAIAEVETEKIKTPEEPAPAPEVIDTPKEEPKAEEPVAQAKVEESDKPVVEEPKPASDETPVAKPAAEEVKEVIVPEPVTEEKSQTPGDAPVESVESAPAAAE